MTEEQRRQLRGIKTFAQLIGFLRDQLDWPIDQGHDEDDLTFDWSDDLGLKDNERVAIKEIKQLRPLETGQPWGIFFVSFEKKQLPIVILRRILNALVLKKRAGANQAQQAAWQQRDLLFISAYGRDDDRQLTFAHFSEPTNDIDASKATLRVLGWDDDDTSLKLDYVADTLKAKLTWPRDTADLKSWRQRWSEAFQLRHHEVIDTAADLALRLAELAKRIRNRMLQVLPRESEKGDLRQLLRGFKDALIHDLDEAQFADMYAQTITYGLFSAAVSRTVPGAGTTVLQENVVDMVPVTNPFLREMLQSFLKAGGRRGKLDFDELGIQEVVDLLNDPKTHMDAVLRDFGNRTRGEDPVIHFYEAFLKAYDKKLKVQRGVFYTPQPVVSYIVRSVHELLQTEFGLADGLADTTTWGEMLVRQPGLKLPPLTDAPGEARTISPDEPFVQILDPATGTATFLVEVIDVIYRTLNAKWQQQRLSDTQQGAAWNEYVPKHLLPRLHAYELMMAPYAIAHMKFGLKLAETGYRFGTEERARIYLTNALEPWVKQLPLIGFEALAHEAVAVNEVKRTRRFTVVIGNPPYSRSSSNSGPFIQMLMQSYKAAVREERNIQPLSDDYIKFIRLSQHILDLVRVGIHGMITNNTFLSGRIHRGMRESLLKTFQFCEIVNLHGSGKVDFLGVQARTDENVFDIMQGVSISILATTSPKPGLSYADLIGMRSKKYDQLSSSKMPEGLVVEPTGPYFLWIPRASNFDSNYENYLSLRDLYNYCSVSGKPGDDSLLISFDRNDVLPKLQSFQKSIASGGVSKLSEAGRNLAAMHRERLFNPDLVIPYAYRPFDTRYTYYDPEIWTRAVRPLKACVDGSPIILTTKIVKDSAFSHVFVSRIFADVIFLSNTSSVNCYSFPNKLSSNTSTPLLSGRYFDNNLDCSEYTNRLGRSVTSDDAMGYIYAILHSPSYRVEYFQFLQYDFPRLPLTGTIGLFSELVRHGRELIALHLLESPTLANRVPVFIDRPNLEIQKISWSADTVWINKAQTSGFRGVPEAVWNFHIGGYQVCEKWLKDRKGRTLSADDIAHYQKIVVALSETIRLMAEIDRVIDAHGGWPGAFQTANEAASAQA